MRTYCQFEESAGAPLYKDDEVNSFPIILTDTNEISPRTLLESSGSKRVIKIMF